MNILKNDILTALLCTLELLHALSHTQVLLGLGPLFSKEVLRSRLWYFISDAVTALTSCCLLIHSRKYRSFEPILAMTAVLHFALHLYYILNWYNTKSSYAQSILDWSSEPYFRRRVTHDGMTMFLFNFTGTLFDVCAHFLLASLLFHFVTS